MLSNDAFKLLKWLEQHDQWMTSNEIKKDCKFFDDRSFKALIDEKVLVTQLAEDGGNWAKYRIKDAGKAYLEGARYARSSNVREWISFGLSVAAIVISIVALLMQEGIL